MSQEIALIGGARIGHRNASYPFAKLIVKEDKLCLNVAMLGNFELEKNDIISIEPYQLVPILGQGVRIFHKIPEYNAKIFFWTKSNPRDLIYQMKQIGFFDEHNSTISVEDLQRLSDIKQSEFPINPFTFIVLFFVSQSFFVSSFLLFPFKSGGFEMLQRGVVVLCAAILATVLLTIFLPGLQNLVLINGRKFTEVKKAFVWLANIVSIILISLLAIPT